MVGHVVPCSSPAPADLPALTVVREGVEVREVPLDQPSLVVGRDPRLVLCLNDLQASRCHAVFTVKGPRAWVRDLNSRNGVFLNGSRVGPGQAIRLRSGDRVRIGQTELVYRPPLVGQGALEALLTASDRARASLSVPAGGPA